VTKSAPNFEICRICEAFITCSCVDRGWRGWRFLSKLRSGKVSRNYFDLFSNAAGVGHWLAVWDVSIIVFLGRRLGEVVLGGGVIDCGVSLGRGRGIVV
jgi:hypothetical protein